MNSKFAVKNCLKMWLSEAFAVKIYYQHRLFRIKYLIVSTIYAVTPL